MILRREHIRADDGSKIYYYKIGNGHLKKKIFFVGGLFSNALMWLPYTVPFVLDYECVLIDIRGHGVSEDRSTVPYGIVSVYSKDVADIFEKEASEENIVVSLSLGSVFVLKSSEWFDQSRFSKKLFIEVPSSSFTNQPDPRKNCFRSYSSTMKEYCEQYYKHNLHVIFKREHHLNYLISPHVDFINSTLDVAIKTTTSGFDYRFRASKIISPKIRNIIFKKVAEIDKKFGSYLKICTSIINETEDYSLYFANQTGKIYVFLGEQNEFLDPEYTREKILEQNPNVKFEMFEKSGHDIMLVEPIKFYKKFFDAIK